MGDLIVPDILYHWSPTARRKGIERRGLVPGSLSVGREWRPPFVCLAGNPVLAWSLSGWFHPEVESWDLWAAFLADGHHLEALPDDRDDSVKEWRCYDRIYKRGVIYVASRSGGDSR